MDIIGIGDILAFMPLGFRIGYYVCLFMAGASFSDFFQCLLYRKSKHIDLFIKRSFCDSCGKRLAWYHLIPVISYVILGGRCAFCGARIDLRYMLSDFFGGTITVFLAFSNPSIPLFVLYSLVLIFIVADDFLANRARVLPLFLFLSLNILSLVIHGIGMLEPLLAIALSASIALLILSLFIKSSAVGVLSFVFISLVVLSRKRLIAELLAALAVAFLYAFFMSLKNRKRLSINEIPFVSFLSLGFVVSFAVMI